MGGYLGINFGALAAGIELGLQPLIAHNAQGQPLYNPYPLSISVPAMCGAHLLVIGWIEAFVTLFVYQYISQNAPEEIYDESLIIKNGKLAKFWQIILFVMAALSPIGLLASGTAWGEWNKKELITNLKADHLNPVLPKGMLHGFEFHPFLADYGLKGISEPIGYILSAVTAILIIAIVIKIWRAFYESRS